MSFKHNRQRDARQGKRMNVKTCCFIFVLILAALAPVVGQDRIELGWQTTRRGIVWYQSGKPTHQPTYRLSRDTNAVLWVDTLTALRYDWDYKTDRWRAKGTTKSALPPLPQQTSGSALIDNTTAFWIRDTFNVLHKYDSTAQAWTPVGDFMYLSDPPTEIAASGSNGAAKYRRSLWQDADTYLVYYWDGSVWQQFGNASGGDNWGSQVVQTTARLSGNGTAGQPLDIAQQGATSGQTLKWNGTSWAPANDLDTSGYNINFSISGDTLYITDGASTKFVNLLPYKDNTDAQTLSIDSVTITAGRRFALSISNGNTIYFEDRDNQQIDTFSISGQVVSLSVQRDGQPAKTITLPTADGSETIVTGANGVVVTGNGTSGTPYVVAPPSGTDTQTLRYSGTTLTSNSSLTNNGAQIGINSAPDGSYRLKVKQSTDTDGIAVERSSSASKLLLYHNANGIVKTNSNNLFFESAGVIGMYPAGGGFISQVSINSQSPITVASGNSGLLRLDATYAPTASGGDFGFLKIYPDINQTGAADQAIYGIDFNPNLINLQGGLYGFRYWPSIGRYLLQPNGDTVSSHLRGRLGIGSGTTDPVRRLHVVGDMRLTGSVDTPTAVMGRDSDGDIANLSLSGLSISAGTLTATDPSLTNEIQRLDTFAIVSNTLRASLLNDGVPFSSVDLSPYLDNTDAQTLSIDSSVISAGQRFALSISGGNTVNFEDEDRQQIDTFSISGQVVSLSIQRDGQPAKTITLPTPDGSETVVTAGTGIGVSGNGTSGTPYVISNTGDLSATNELQTLNNTGDATSHTATLSSSGGSLKLKEGSNITLTTDATGLNGEVTISATAPASDGNGIYGDGTAGSGNDALPPGGSTVTIPGQWQPLNFAVDNSAGQVHTALKVTTDYCADDAYTKYLVGKSPSDSLEIYNFDCGGGIKETGGILEVITDKELYLNADSINLSTVPARTIGASMLAMDGTGFVRKISGSSSGQILQWNGSNWALAAAPSGGITGAENGLTTVGSNVRLGGTLITTTIIGQAGFDLRTYGGKYGHSQYTGFSYSPTQTFGVSGYEGNPTTGSSPTADGIAEFVASTTGGSEQPNSLTIGALTTDNNGMWMQARSRAVPNFYYPLLAQPNGGRFAVGRSGTTASHFTVTASGLTGSTASGMVGLFENSGGSGNVSVGFGAGSDAVSGQLMWNGTNDVMRIINRNGVSGTSKISFAIGGETSDRAHLIYSSTAPNALFSVGQTAANTHSTVQSGGSFATAFRSVTAGTTLTVADRTVVYTLNSTVTFTLPSAVGIAGREYIIHHFGSGGNISLSSSVISSTGTTFSAVGARQWAYIISDGTNWQGYLLTSL